MLNIRYYRFAIIILLIASMFRIYNTINEYITKEDTRDCFVSFFDGEIKNSQDNNCKDADLNLYGKCALLMDGKNRRVLYEKNGNRKVPMASTTKIMTLLVALENGNLDRNVNVSSYAASMPKVHLGVRKGEQYRLRDLLYSLMLESHNDSAVVIAEAIGGSVEGFAELMNQKAKEIGAVNTHFVTPNGLDDDMHYTTAYDLALITSTALENKEFCEIIKTRQYSFHEQTKGRELIVNNKNLFLDMNSNAIGVKTGFTGNAGYCFVGAIEQNDRLLVSVTLASGWPPHKTYKWKDTQALMNYGSKEYDYQIILHKDKKIPHIDVEDSIENCPVSLMVKEEVALLVGKHEKITYKMRLPDKLQAPVYRNQIIGKMEIRIDNHLYKVVPIVASEDRHLRTFTYVLKKVLFKYMPE